MDTTKYEDIRYYSDQRGRGRSKSCPLARRVVQYVAIKCYVGLSQEVAQTHQFFRMVPVYIISEQEELCDILLEKDDAKERCQAKRTKGIEQTQEKKGPD